MPYLSLVLLKPRYSNAIQKRKAYVYALFGNRCHDCGRIKKQKRLGKTSWNLHHLSYPYGYDPNWDWIHVSEKKFKDDILPEIIAVCILLCEPCHRKRHHLPPINRRTKCQKQ